MSDPEFWRTRLRDEGRTRHFRRGERLLLQGFGRGTVLVIQEGTLRILATTFEGDEVTLSLCRAGDVVGSHSALGGGPIAAGAIAIEDGSVTILSADRFVDIVSEEPELMLAEIHNLIRLLHNAESRLIDIATEDVAERVRRQLVRLCRDQIEPIVLPLTHEDLASMVGAARSSIAPVLADLRKSGAISTTRGHVVVDDLHTLSTEAGTTSP